MADGYVLFGQVQEVKRIYYEENRVGLNFAEAVRRLIDENSVFHKEPDIPDFLSWNLTDYKEFRSLVYQVPVYIDEVLGDSAQIADGVKHFFTGPNVQITLESCYSAEELVAVESFSVLYVLKGGCHLHLSKENYVMKSGEACILLPQTPHNVFTTPDDLVFQISSAKSHFLHHFNQILQYNNLVTDFFRRSLLEKEKGHHFFMIPPEKDIRSLIQHLFAEYVKKDTYSEIFFNNYLQIFYGNIIRGIDSTYQYYSVQEKTSAKILIPAMLDYITRNYRTLTLNELSERFHYEPHYMCRIIKEATGRTLNAMIAELKNIEAKRLLEETTLSVELIADKAGYNSADYFSYCFKKQTGMSPSNYRKQKRFV